MKQNQQDKVGDKNVPAPFFKGLPPTDAIAIPAAMLKDF
jgi:hypothetical protein